MSNWEDAVEKALKKNCAKTKAKLRQRYNQAIRVQQCQDFNFVSEDPEVKNDISLVKAPESSVDEENMSNLPMKHEEIEQISHCNEDTKNIQEMATISTDTSSRSIYKKKYKTSKQKTVPNLSHLSVAVTTEPFHSFTPKMAASVKRTLEHAVFAACIPLDSDLTAYAPSFVNSFSQDGVFKIWCEDDASLAWLQKNVSNLESPCPGSTLIVVKQEDLQVKAGVLIPQYNGEMNMLYTILKAQNPWYNIASWILLGAEIKHNGVFLRLSFSKVEEECIIAREKRLSFSTGSVNIKFYGEFY